MHSKAIAKHARHMYMNLAYNIREGNIMEWRRLLLLFLVIRSLDVVEAELVDVLRRSNNANCDR